ncbi:hypothetical protein IC762_12725 [Bradyrhizobium genosp. L]|uniref:hypothetical protein n=1 Tax=Bradyrhizobium genosp. L TaxID=83637 RepID=UPI0018A26010|nr:hypothetical protein [Bradyrhizobium genosp. L]QPF87104.1 hypothetical protein IC762_12725 [Bradyrhizobium genosp. L]
MDGKIVALGICIAAFGAIGRAPAGECLSRPRLAQLNSDTVHWTIEVARWAECLQGLRGKTMLIDQVRIVDPPKAGTLTLSGPSFRYTAPATDAADSFRLEITGENRKVRGTSVIEVDVVPR